MYKIVVIIKTKGKESEKKMEQKKDVKEIKNKRVEEIFALCGISRVMPISFDKLSKNFKVNICGTDFSYLSNLNEVKEILQSEKKILGMVNIENDFANIYYNNNPEIDIPTQRFTIAHELAHCINHYDELSKAGKVEFLGEDEDNIDDLLNDNNDIHEYVCNKFARDFLIPTEMLKKIYNAMQNPQISDLANLFLVPEKQMNIKLKEIGLGV